MPDLQQSTDQRYSNVTRDEFDLCVFAALTSCDFPCAVAAWEFSTLEPISSAIFYHEFKNRKRIEGKEFNKSK